MKPCKFTFDDGKVFDGFALGSTWNGFDNVAVTKTVAAQMEAHFGDDPDNYPFHEIEPDEQGLIDLSFGFTTQIVAVGHASGSLGLHNELGRDQATLAQRKANAPLLARVAQAPCDVGLFSDDAAQTDLIDRVRR